jgi:hypothetical protein
MCLRAEANDPANFTNCLSPVFLFEACCAHRKKHLGLFEDYVDSDARPGGPAG